MALLIGLFIAIFLATLVFSPFLLLVMRLGQKRPITSVILFGIGIYIAIQVFQLVFGEFIEGLTP